MDKLYLHVAVSGYTYAITVRQNKASRVPPDPSRRYRIGSTTYVPVAIIGLPTVHQTYNFYQIVFNTPVAATSANAEVGMV